jgi:hydrogenase maturation protein HypF
MPNVQMKIKVVGIVQGVGFRPFIYRIAINNKLKGYVRNQGDAGVEIFVDGLKKNIESFLNDLKFLKPPLAKIYQIFKYPQKNLVKFKKFSIQNSTNNAENIGSIIPSDISICNSCLKELNEPKNPRFKYFFITCTNCGPRFTIIDKIPYDRENTLMRNFHMCNFCRK